MTLDEQLEVFEEVFGERGRGCGQNTVINYRYNLFNLFLKWWGDKDLSELTDDDIDDYILTCKICQPLITPLLTIETSRPFVPF